MMCRVKISVLVFASVGLVSCGDNTRPLKHTECDTAIQVSKEFKGRVRVLRRTLEDDILLLGRYPEERAFVTRLVARNHQPPLREAVGLAQANLGDLIDRMVAAGCNRP